MVRLWDEMDSVRVYFTGEELEEEQKPVEPVPIYVAYVDGVFYKAPEIEVRHVSK